MRRLLNRVISLWLILVAWAIAGCGTAAEREISILVPPFEGPPGLSRSVNTILRLQIWQTLRKGVPGKDLGMTFGAGSVKWGPAHLPSLRHASAEAMARHARILSQLVLWGTVQEYGDGAVVQAFLSAPWYEKLNDRYYEDFRIERSEVWLVVVPVAGEPVEFRQDVPRRRLSFEPIVLSKEILEKYSGLDAIVMYDPRDPGTPIGTLGDVITAVEQHGNRALVTSGGRTGTVLLPELSNQRSEVVDFASGLIRVFRRDWEGARSLFADVVKNKRAPTDIRIDAYLYRAMANNQLGRSGTEDIEQARALNPYAVRVLRFAIMDKLAELSRAVTRRAPQNDQHDIIVAIEQIVANGKHLFLRKDPWFEHLRSGLERITQAQSIDGQG